MGNFFDRFDPPPRGTRRNAAAGLFEDLSIEGTPS
jgi:hypothetical protein